MKTKTIHGFEGLDYVTIMNVPIRDSKYGEIIDMSPHEFERKVAIALIEHRVPIRGIELKVIRSAMGLSLAEIANKIGVHQNSVLNWCKDHDKRLALPYEMLFRFLVAEIFGISLEGGIDDLKASNKSHPIEIMAA